MSGHAATPTPTAPTSGGPHGVIGAIIVVAAIVGAIAFGQEQATERAAHRAEAIANMPPAPPRVVEVLREPEYHDFAKEGDAEGCITLHLTRNARTYPKGGKMNIYAPDGKVYTEAPGVDFTMPEQRVPADFKFCKAESATTGFEILR